MALFHTSDGNVKLIKPKDIGLEKDLQSLVENNLETIFNCRFVATEFSTGHEHAGRIDSLALSEDNNPVIIEYKKVESSELVNQSLYYLAWLRDHKGDFQVAVSKKLGDVSIDWNDIRLTVEM
jgi:RecB family endonuclease NucS